MNPTNNKCPSDINALDQTDFRPKKHLYSNIMNNEDWRRFVTKNANAIRHNNLRQHVQSMNCKCEPRKYQESNYIVPFDSSRLDNIENSTVPKLEEVYPVDPTQFKKIQF